MCQLRPRQPVVLSVCGEAEGACLCGVYGPPGSYQQVAVKQNANQPSRNITLCLQRLAVLCQTGRARGPKVSKKGCFECSLGPGQEAKVPFSADQDQIVRKVWPKS